MQSILEFVSSFLEIIIFHRNQLKHYRSSMSSFKEMSSYYVDIDFAENLTVPVKHEPQSLHWCHEQVTVHSGILKARGEKSYHVYLSEDKGHDYVFVCVALEEILSEVDTDQGSTLVIESDNCSSQYKSAGHFYDIQELANGKNIVIIRIYGIAGHGKGEVDHVGGLTKVAVRTEIAAGEFFLDSESMVEFLDKKFRGNQNPLYFFKDIDHNKLESVRAEEQLRKHKTIEGSSAFQVIVFQPNSAVFRAAPRICLCEHCKVSYGSCELFGDMSLAPKL